MAAVAKQEPAASAWILTNSAAMGDFLLRKEQI